MKTRQKIFSITFMMMLFLSLFMLIVPVNAYSTETTGLQFSNFDSTQQTYVKVGSHNVFCATEKIVDYDNNGNLLGSLAKPQPSVYGTQVTTAPHFNTTRIYYFNSTHILIGFTTMSRSGSSTYVYATNYEYGLIRLDTFGYTKLQGTYVTLETLYFQDDANAFSSCGFATNKNSTGEFYYFWFSAVITNSPNNYGDDVMIYIGKLVSGTYTLAYASKADVTFTGQNPNPNIIRGCPLVLDSLNYPISDGYFYFISSNAWTDGNRANIYIYNIALSTFTYIGVTSNDWTYTGYSSAVTTSNFVYLIGVGAYSGKINVNLAYSTTASGTQLNFETIVFNTTYISQNFLSIGVSTNSAIARPFTVGWSTGLGNTSALYGMGYFDDIYSSWALTGISATLTGIETNTPSWTYYQTFLWTPQLPQTYPYSATSNNWGGFQPIGSNVGCFMDIQNGKCKANYCATVNTQTTLTGTLTGGIFTGGSIPTSPTETSLQQSLTYTFTGYVYQNGISNVNGTYSILTTALSSYPSILTDTAFSNKIDTAFSMGQFSFTIAPITSNTVMYRRIQVNITCTDGTSLVNIYNFGFYGLGMGGTNGTPYPNQGGGSNGNGGSTAGQGGNGGAFVPTVTVSPIFWAGLVLTLVLSLVFAGFAGKDGLMAGLVVGIALSCTFGLFPIYLLIIDIIIGALLVLSKSGYIGGN